MTFLPADDHMLIMNVNSHMYSKHGQCESLTDEDLSRLRDVGAKTIVQYSMWSELVARGWNYLDMEVALAHKHGMRSLICTYYGAPPNLPKEWYCWKPDGTVGVHDPGGAGLCALSLWNMEARAALLVHIGKIVNRYPRDTASVVFSGWGAGEAVLPMAYFYEPAALKSHSAEVGGRPDPDNLETRAWVNRAVVDYYISINEVLLPQHNQTWNMMHRVLLKNNESCGIGAQEDIFAAEYERWPGADRYLLQYTYWGHSKGGHKTILDGWRDKYKLQTIVEAGYCSGLPTTAPLAIAAGMRGQIVAPRHPEMHETHLRQEHVDAIKDAIQLWEQA